jgi:uncharacterized protein YaiE (UPF0345 family)
MSQFSNVTINKEANIYFNGKVTSRTLLFGDGTKKTLGIMLPGEYEFGTEAKELMEIFSGDLEIKLVNEEWKKISAGQSFEVPANSSFKLKIYKVIDYCCSYL